MLTYKDCLGMCDFDEDEIAAVAEHEHLPRMAAIAYAEYLIHTDEGVPMLKKIILDDIAAAERLQNRDKVEHLKQVLRHFVLTHPHHTRA
ncbi:MAG: hypothetical protein OEN20_13040 [Gammaproteobacteria bacterium]|nr:hypothetical protein [Gammaproteobacteria bacterium]